MSIDHKENQQQFQIAVPCVPEFYHLYHPLLVRARKMDIVTRKRGLLQNERFAAALFLRFLQVAWGGAPSVPVWTQVYSPRSAGPCGKFQFIRQ